MTNVLTREEGLKDGITPTGRKIAVEPIKHSALYRIQFADGKGGLLPDNLRGMYTSRPRANEDLTKYLKDFWDTSDSVKKKEKATS